MDCTVGRFIEGNRQKKAPKILNRQWSHEFDLIADFSFLSHKNWGKLDDIINKHALSLTPYKGAVMEMDER